METNFDKFGKTVHIKQTMNATHGTVFLIDRLDGLSVGDEIIISDSWERFHVKSVHLPNDPQNTSDILITVE